MFDYAINNETARGANLPPFLIVNHIYEGDTAMTKAKDNRKKLKSQYDIGVFQLPLFDISSGGLSICPVCHKPFSAKSRGDRIQKTCSNKCSSISQTSASIRFCKECGNPFRASNFEKESRVYCSIKCFHKGSKGQRRSTGTEFKKGLIPKGGIKTRFKTGADHPLWKGGVSHKHSTIRRSREYAEWRKAVYQRDHYECQECNKHCRSLDIVAHHIKSFAEHKHLRFEVDNGITLCRSCHIRLHKTNGDLS